MNVVLVRLVIAIIAARAPVNAYANAKKSCPQMEYFSKVPGLARRRVESVGQPAGVSFFCLDESVVAEVGEDFHGGIFLQRRHRNGVRSYRG